MSPLEAVARAIAKCGGTEWDCDPTDPADVYMGLARAALTALRDNGVTEGMVEAALSAQRGDNIEDFIKREYRAMLDAALDQN